MRQVRHHSWKPVVGSCLVVFCLLASPRGRAQTTPTDAPPTNSGLPSVRFREATVFIMPGIVNAWGENHHEHEVDSNSPAYWDGDTFYLINSFLHPWRNSGPDLFHLSAPVSTHLGSTNDRLWIWIESTWKDDDGTLYGIYHYEPDNVCFGNSHLPTAPKIGWLRSIDNGLSWSDLGFVLAADPADFRCDTQSPWDAGGEGDFSVMLDHVKDYFYIFFSSYVKNFQEQGVGVARLRYADRDNPAGKAQKWHCAKVMVSITATQCRRLILFGRKSWSGGRLNDARHVYQTYVASSFPGNAGNRKNLRNYSDPFRN